MGHGNKEYDADVGWCFVNEVQEIYHTHSFSAISILLHGNYMEAFFDPNKHEFWEEPRNRSRIIYIPRDRYHQITKTEGCRTIMITGPWGDCYKEYKPDTDEIIVSTHGRKEIARYKSSRGGGGGASSTKLMH